MTTKQKLVVSKLVENGGNIGKAMIAAGYSPATAKTPQKLTESKGWRKLVVQNLYPDETTLKTLDNLFNAVKLKRLSFPVTMKNETIQGIFKDDKGFKLLQIIEYKRKKTAFYTMPDAMTQLKALDMIYRLEGYYSHQEASESSAPIDEAIEKVSRLLP